MQKWEYKTIEIVYQSMTFGYKAKLYPLGSINECPRLSEALQELGSQGCEMVCKDGDLGIFKRPIEE